MVSVPSNIAEGAARASATEFIQDLHIAGRSLSELDTQIEIARNLNFLDNAAKTTMDRQIDSISRRLNGLIKPDKGRIVHLFGDGAMPSSHELSSHIAFDAKREDKVS